MKFDSIPNAPSPDKNSSTLSSKSFAKSSSSGLPFYQDILSIHVPLNPLDVMQYSPNEEDTVLLAPTSLEQMLQFSPRGNGSTYSFSDHYEDDTIQPSNIFSTVDGASEESKNSVVSTSNQIDDSSLIQSPQPNHLKRSSNQIDDSSLIQSPQPNHIKHSHLIEKTPVKKSILNQDFPLEQESSRKHIHASNDETTSTNSDDPPTSTKVETRSKKKKSSKKRKRQIQDAPPTQTKKPKKSNSFSSSGQTDCCVKDCDNQVTNRLRWSLKCKTDDDFKSDYLARDWNKVCSHCYFSALYFFKNGGKSKPSQKAPSKKQKKKK